MDALFISQLLIVVGFTGFLGFVGVFIILSMRAKKEQQHAYGQVTSKGFKGKINQFLQKTYKQLLRVPVLNKLLHRVRKRIETLAVYDEYRLRREVMKVMFSILAISIIICLFLAILRPTWLVTVWIFIGLLFISGGLIDFFVHRVEFRLLSQLKEFNGRVRFGFQQTKMVDEAVFEATQHVGPEMKIQSERIHDILVSVEPDKELTKYEEVAPTRFLKVLAGLSLLVKDKGDVVSEKGSAFIRSLSAINQELNNEIQYRSKLSYKLKGLSIITIVPIFLALPIKNWAVVTFPVMQTFYDSRIGFLAEILVYIIAVVCYLLIRKMREVSEVAAPAQVKRFEWEEKLFKKVPVIEKMVSVLSPEQHTKKYAKLTELIKDANSQSTVKHITLHKVLWAIGIFILLLSGMIFAHHKEVNSVLNTFVPETMLAGEITEADIAYQKQVTEFDKDLLTRIKSSDVTVTDDILKRHIATELDLEVNDPQVIATYERIIYKWSVVENSFLKWWELLIIVLITVLATQIPVYNLKFKRYLRYKQMEVEVYQHLVLISSLREFEHMSVHQILEWMERFSVVFKEPIQIAIQDYYSGPDEALEQLSHNVSFEPFQQIVERLKLSLVRISIKESFDDIDMERQFYLEQRKEEQERSIESRGVLGSMIGMAPAASLIFVYLVAPLMYIAIVESSNIMTKIM